MVFVDYNKCHMIYYKYFDQNSKKLRNINLGNQICQGVVSVYFERAVPDLEH